MPIVTGNGGQFSDTIRSLPRVKSPMKILIMGAGAVGAYYGAQLQRAGEDVVFCARGDNLRALRENGLEIKSFKGDLKLPVNVTGDPKEFGPYDLILFAVKSYDTESAAT